MTTSASDHEPENRPIPNPPANGVAKTFYIVLGWLMVGIGAVGVVVPGLPTTIFLIVALWAFARGSARFHRWLYTHPTFGPPLQAWHAHRVIPLRAKILAVSVMILSWLVLTLWLTEGWQWPTAIGITLAAVALYIVTRPSRPRSPDR